MTISSRTPEGTPNHCPVCNYPCWVVPSKQTRDAPCPRCGHLLWFDQPHQTEPVVDANLHQEEILPDEPIERVTKRRRKYDPELTVAQLAALANRPKRCQNAPKARELRVQVARLIRRLVTRAVERFGQPGTQVAIELASVVEPLQAERLLSLLPTAQSWGQLMANWHSERS